MTNPLKTRMKAGDDLIGAWCNLPCMAIAEIAGQADFDFVVVDFQHGLIDEAMGADLFRAIEATGASPVARAGWKDPARLGKLLDYGAAAVIVPMVESADDAADIVSACLYPPNGRRSFGPIRAIRGRSRRDYMAQANDDACILPMIETMGALTDLSEIARTPGVSGLFVGPADLSLALGLPPARDNPDTAFQDALKMVVGACKQADIAAGIQAERTLAARRLSEGFSFVTAAMDSADLTESFHDTLRAVRR